MIQMLNTKFKDSDVFCFWVKLITHTHTHTDTHTDTHTGTHTDTLTDTHRHADTHTHRPNTRNVIFGFRGPQNM